MSTPTVEIPADITPQAFYEDLLPRIVREGSERAAQAAPHLSQINLDIGVEVQGEGGGVWTLGLSGGNLEVRPEAAVSPLVKFVQTREDWQVTITQGLGRFIAKLASGTPPPPPPPGSLPRPGLTPQKVDRMRSLRGVMNFDITGYQGLRTIRLKVVLSGAEEGKDPTCVISVSAADYREIATGRMQLQQAFMAGKVRILGDMAFAMQVGTTLMMP